MSESFSNTRVRRSRYIFLRIEDRRRIDFSGLLQGAIGVGSHPTVYVDSVLRGQACVVTDQELRVLLEVPADRWIDQGVVARRLGVSHRLLGSIAEKGLLLSTSSQKELRAFRQREETLSAQAWNPYSALYHFATKWKDVRTLVSWPVRPEAVRKARLEADSAIDAIASRFGSPPSPFYSTPGSKKRIPLGRSPRDGELYRLLRLRKTSRSFDGRRPVSRGQLETLLECTFGCHGYQTTGTKRLTWLKKTSPSGGALHPTEAYPLVINVRGIEPGLYHYRVQDHSLDLLEPLSRRQARNIASEFTAGQEYARNAGALFVMASRFYRNFWKYRGHGKAYKVLLMDAAHLSQTFYLVCAELGLGAFFTAAINGSNAEARLGLDPYQQGVLAICGCGVTAEGIPTLDFEPLPYRPAPSGVAPPEVSESLD